MVNSKVKNSSTIYFSEYIKIRLSKIDGKMVRIPMALKKNRKSENKYWFADGKLVYVYNKNSLDLEVYQERIRRFFYEKVYNNFGQKGISVKEYKVKLSEIMSNCKWYSCQFSEEVTIDLVAKAAEDELISVEVVGDEVVFKNE